MFKNEHFGKSANHGLCFLWSRLHHELPIVNAFSENYFPKHFETENKFQTAQKHLFPLLQIAESAPFLLTMFQKMVFLYQQKQVLRSAKQPFVARVNPTRLPNRHALFAKEKCRLNRQHFLHSYMV